jgi:hypothetical protein
VTTLDNGSHNRPRGLVQLRSFGFYQAHRTHDLFLYKERNDEFGTSVKFIRGWVNVLHHAELSRGFSATDDQRREFKCNILGFGEDHAPGVSVWVEPIDSVEL